LLAFSQRSTLLASTTLIGTYNSEIRGVASVLYGSGTSSKSHTVTLNSGQVVTDINFGNRQTIPTAGNDTLTGTSGNDTIDGLAGDDIRVVG
jgi:Ca2+-binding RTX toxin-like protein